MSRMLGVCGTLLADYVHEYYFGNFANDVIGVSFYLVTSLLFMSSLIVFYAHILRAKLSSDLMNLAYLAMLLNSMAWVLYMTAHSLKTINIMVEALTYVMYARLMWIRDGDLDVGGWRDYCGRVIDWCKKVHFKEAKI